MGFGVYGSARSLGELLAARRALTAGALVPVLVDGCRAAVFFAAFLDVVFFFADRLMARNLPHASNASQWRRVPKLRVAPGAMEGGRRPVPWVRRVRGGVRPRRHGCARPWPRPAPRYGMR